MCNIPLTAIQLQMQASTTKSSMRRESVTVLSIWLVQKHCNQAEEVGHTLSAAKTNYAKVCVMK